MSKIRLANGNVYDVKDGATQYYLGMTFNSLGEYASVLEDFTEESLKTIEFLSDDGEVISECSDKKVINTVMAPLNNRTFDVEIHLGDVVYSAEEILNIILGGVSTHDYD